MFADPSKTKGPAWPVRPVAAAAERPQESHCGSSPLKTLRQHTLNNTMSLAATRVIASRTLVRRATAEQQKRGIVDYLTNYPDKVSPSP